MFSPNSSRYVLLADMHVLSPLSALYLRSASEDTLAEWLRRWPAKPMGFPRESSNLSGVEFFFSLSLFAVFSVEKLID